MKNVAVTVLILLLPVLGWSVYHFEGSYEVHGCQQEMIIRDNLAYVEDMNGDLRILDVTNPGEPVLLGQTAIPLYCNGMALDGYYLYMVFDPGGLHIYDVSDPVNPFEVATACVNDHYQHVFVQEDVVYASSPFDGLWMFDVSDPVHPQHLATYPIDCPWCCAVDDNHVAYVCSYNVGQTTLYAVDLTLFDNPQVLDSLLLPTNSWSNIHERDGMVYVAGENLYFINASDPADLQIEGLIPGCNAHDVLLHEDKAYVSLMYYGMSVYSIADHTQPELISVYDTPGTAHAVQLSGKHAFIADGWEGVRCVDVSDATNQFLSSTVLDTSIVVDVEVHDDVLYSLEYNDGLYIHNVTDPDSPLYIATRYDGGNFYQEMTIDNGRLYWGSLTSLSVMNLTHNTEFEITATLDVEAPRFAIDRNLLYAVGSYDPLRAYNIDPLDEPVELDCIAAMDDIRKIVLHEDRLYMASNTEGLRVVNVQDPLSLKYLPFPFTNTLEVYGLEVHDDVVYICDRTAGIYVIEEQPVNAAPRFIPLPEPAKISKLKVQNDHLYAMDRNCNTLFIFDVTYAAQPRLIRSFAWNLGMRDVAEDGDYLYVATGYHGVAALRLHDLLPTTDTSAPAPTPTLTCRPNPFNPTTTIAWSQVQSGAVSLSVYNVRGQRVATLVAEQRPEGEHSVVWQGRNDDGKPVGSGVYFARLHTPDHNETMKMLLMK